MCTKMSLFVKETLDTKHSLAFTPPLFAIQSPRYLSFVCDLALRIITDYYVTFKINELV